MGRVRQNHVIYLNNLQVDKNHRGWIDFDDFLSLIAHYANAEVDTAEILEAFSAFDDDGNGTIKVEDLKLALTNLGDKMDDEEFTELLRLADVKKDGVIKYKSFVEMVEGKKRKGKKKRAIESIS